MITLILSVAAGQAAELPRTAERRQGRAPRTRRAPLYYNTPGWVNITLIV